MKHVCQVARDICSHTRDGQRHRNMFPDLLMPLTSFKSPEMLESCLIVCFIISIEGASNVSDKTCFIQYCIK